MQRAQNYLCQLYEDVREFAAPVRLNKVLLCLDESLNDAWATLAVEHEGRTVDLRMTNTGVDLRCDADEFALQQIFRNVLANALSASEDPVEIEVVWSETKLDGREAIHVTVRDNGPGLNEEQRAHIFDEFYTTKPRGTGLGMAIVKRLVDEHGGQIAVGETHGSGAEVIITLPRSTS
jgi:signal transduction histidine kinase